jgi:hypothetical protein
LFIALSFFGRCQFQVLTKGAKAMFSMDDLFEITDRESNNFQTLVGKTWLQLVPRPPKQE